MKNVNIIILIFLIGTIPTVTMAQNVVNWRNTHTQVDRTHSLTHLHQNSYNHFVRSASSAITISVTEFGIKSLFLRYLKIIS